MRGRVIQARARPDGSFAVTLVLDDGPESYGWMVAQSHPRLGTLLEFEGADVEVLTAGRRRVSMIRGGKSRVVPDAWARRWVPRPWLRAVARASKRRLYPHQIEGAAWLAQRLAEGRGSILADDQGLGKTTQATLALLVARALPALIVCPASLKRSWEREVEHAAVPLKVAVLDGFQGAIPQAHLVIANYDLLAAREGQLRELRARAVVFDEGHLLKEPVPSKTHRAAVATRLAHQIRRTVILTGTPLPNKTGELWRLLHVVAPQEWRSYEDFRERYCVAGDEVSLEADPDELVTEYGRVHRLGELQARTNEVMLRRLKTNVLRDLPPKRRQAVLVDLAEQERRLYDRVESDFVQWLVELGAQKRAEGARRAEALAKLQMLRRIAALGKLRAAIPSFLRDWFSKRSHRRGLVVFGYHRDVLEGVSRAALSLGLRLARIKSSEHDMKRQEEVDRFNDGGADVFVAPILAAGVGLNLQGNSSDVLFVERLWTPSGMAQAEDRVHRLGQRYQVTISYLDARDTVDEHVARVLAAKQRLIDAVVDGRMSRAKAEAEQEDAVGDVLERMAERQPRQRV